MAFALNELPKVLRIFLHFWSKDHIYIVPISSTKTSLTGFLCLLIFSPYPGRVVFFDQVEPPLFLSSSMACVSVHPWEVMVRSDQFDASKTLCPFDTLIFTL